MESATTLKTLIFSNDSFWKATRVSSSFDPDQARHFTWLNLDPNCLQRISADSTGSQRVKDKFHVLLSACWVIFHLLFFQNLFFKNFLLG